MYKLLFCIVLYVFLIDYSHCYSKLFGININNNAMCEFCVFVVDSLKKGCDYTTIHESYYGRSFYEVKRGGILFCIFSVTNNDDWVLTKKDNIGYFDKLKIRRMLFIINNDDLNFNNCFSFVYCKIKDFIYLNTQIKQFLCFFIKKIFVDVKNSFCINISNEIFNITCPIFKKKSLFVVNNSFFSVSPSIKKINVLNVFKPVITKYDWRWPTDGKIIDHFSAVEGGNKGIDISGSLGQPILAAANGKVIYAGNALRGYGNLIIIQHSNDYLSAYAHNELILVSEHQKVEAGQKIATMGHTETNLVKLHFEIRYKGKSVNPLCYLP